MGIFVYQLLLEAPIHRLDTRDDQRLKHVFFSGEPWLMYCAKKADERTCHGCVRKGPVPSRQALSSDAASPPSAQQRRR